MTLWHKRIYYIVVFSAVAVLFALLSREGYLLCRNLFDVMNFSAFLSIKSAVGNTSHTLNPDDIASIISFCVLTLLLGAVLLMLGWRSLKQQANLRKVQADLNDMLAHARSVTRSVLNRSSDGRPRIDIKKMYVTHIIDPDGTTRVTRLYLISCPKSRATAYEVWFEADDESDPISGYRPLKLYLEDKTLGRALDWIPTAEHPRKKRFAIFFPEIEPGTEKEIEISYIWPRYMSRILEKGSTEFWWGHRPASPDAIAHIIYEWIYLEGFPAVTTELLGEHGEMASLSCEERPNGLCWRYENPKARLEKKNYRVSIKLV